MRQSQSVRAIEGFVVTEQGSLDLRVAPTCNCNPRLAGLLIECPDCGTVYGSLKDSLSSTPRREKTRWD